MKLGPVEVTLSTRAGEEYKYKIALSEISSVFQKIPGATDILDEVYQEGMNRYELFNKMVSRDSGLNSAINKLAMLVERAYQGVYIHPGDQEEESEKEFLEQVKKDVEHLKIGELFYACARRLCIDGDVVINVKRLSSGHRWDFLPMMKVTALRSASHVGQSTDDGSSLYSGPANVYVYDEGGVNQHIYRRKSIIHIPLNNKAEQVMDSFGRWTWGIWSHSPLESLRPDVYWALSSKVNDMMWRRLYLPREHHQLDVTDLMDLSRYEGDDESERREAAISAVSSAITTYIDGLKGQLPDQGYVTPKVGEVNAVTIEIIEPKSTNYVSPNELLQQLSSTIAAAYYTRLSDKTSSSYAAEHIIASDTQVAAEYLAKTIKRYILAEVKSWYEGNEHAEKLDIRLQLILPKDMESLVRESAVLRAAGVMTIDEIRVRYLGLDPLTDEQRKQLEKEEAMTRGGSQEGEFSQSRDQITQHFITRRPEEKDEERVPGKRGENTKT